MTDFRRRNLAPDVYDRLKDEQDNRCAICKKPQSHGRNGKPMALSVDHDHRTGKVRGLLCHRHNLALGGFDDDVELLQVAIDYLKRSAA